MGAHMPERVMTNDEIATFLETSDQWIASRTGIRQRRIAAGGESPAGLGAEAAQRALESAGMSGADLDLIVTATASPDYYFPATATLIGERIGARGVAGYDLSAACTGFIYALAQAYGQLGAGLADTVLVVGTEVFSRLLDWGDRSTCVLFGDGAGAVVLARNGSTSGILGFELGSDGSGAELLEVAAAGHSTEPAATPYVRMDGAQVYKFATTVSVDSATRALDGRRPDRRGRRRVRPAPGQPAHHRPRRPAARARPRTGSSRTSTGTATRRPRRSRSASTRRTGRAASRRATSCSWSGFGGGLSWGSCVMEWTLPLKEAR